jgi:hypothetical protein
MPLLLAVCYVTRESGVKSQKCLTEICLLVAFNWVVPCAVEVIEDDTRMGDLDVSLREHVSMFDRRSVPMVRCDLHQHGRSSCSQLAD